MLPINSRGCECIRTSSRPALRRQILRQSEPEAVGPAVSASRQTREAVMNFRQSLFGIIAIFAATGSAVAANQTVTVGTGGSGMSFSPATVTINKGESVTFTYPGGVLPHNVAANDG